MIYVTLLATKNIELNPEGLIIGTRFNIKMLSHSEIVDFR